MDKLNILDAIATATRIEVPVNSTRLGRHWVEISKSEAVDLMTWHDLQHMTVLDVNLYVPVQTYATEQGSEATMRIGL